MLSHLTSNESSDFLSEEVCPSIKTIHLQRFDHSYLVVEFEAAGGTCNCGAVCFKT